MEIEHHKKLSASGALPLVTEASLFLYNANYLSDESIAWAYDDEVICATLNESLIGIMTFIDYDDESQIFIKISYVKFEFRGQGIHGKMYAMLKDIARERGIKYTRSGVHIDNTEMQDHLEKQGRKRCAIIYEDVI